MQEQSRFEPVSCLSRFHIYAVHGLAIEIFFTAGWEIVTQHNCKMPGISSVWAYFIYGSGLLVQEKMYLYMDNKKVNILIRGMVYLLWTYTFEFCTGFALKQFNACPWDYEPWFAAHFMGLITPVYAPLWFVSNLLAERYLMKNAFRLHWDNQITYKMKN